MTTPPSPLPGWYPDPSGAPGQRYWDGSKWTDVNIPPSPPSVPSPGPGRRGSALKVLAIIGAVIFALVGGCTACVAVIGHNISSTSSSSTSSNNSPTPWGSAPETRQTSVAPSTPGINQEARDGKFAFTVTGVTTSKTVPDSRSEPKTAQGVYVIVSMTVKNIGDRAQGYYGDNQKLIDRQGRQFSPDSMADIAVNGDNDGTDVNPGNQIKVSVAFDVPDSTQPTQVVLHDSAYSGGVKANLS
jgi:hypothetical protein